MRDRRRILLWIAGALVLIVLIAAFVLFGPPRVADTFAEPEFCGSCHEMEPWLEGFRESDHSDLDSCNDCHLPHDSVVSYYFWEGVVGTRDLVKHAVGAIPETIEPRERTRVWVRDNCLRCHDDEIEEGHTEGREFCSAPGCHDDVFHDVEQE
jgi:cytochrome c nitrite reductase small subunit